MDCKLIMGCSINELRFRVTSPGSTEFAQCVLTQQENKYNYNPLITILDPTPAITNGRLCKCLIWCFNFSVVSALCVFQVISSYYKINDDGAEM